MILLVHMLFGAAIGSLAGNVYLGIFAALLCHYFLDLFPHIEYLESTKKSIINVKHRSVDAAKVVADFGIGIFLLYTFSSNHPAVYLYAFVAIVPDGLTVLTHLFPNTLLLAHDYVHGGPIHYLTKQKQFPVGVKILTQLTAILVSIFILWH